VIVVVSRLTKKGDGMPTGNEPYEFFTGIIQGAVGRAPMLVNGMRRTAGNLGFTMGVDAQNRIIFHNHLTRQAARYGFNFIIGGNLNPATVQRVWNQLPEDAHNRVTDWAANTGGQMLGGTAVSTAVGRVLTGGLRLPRQIVLPAMFVVGIQGAMAAIWRDVD
jgi:hypothetical protein